VHFQDFPAKGLKFIPQGSQMNDRIGGPVNLLPVDINGGDEVIQLMMGGKKDGLPVLPFLQLPISMKGKNPSGVPIPFFGHGSTAGHAHPLTERTTGDPHSRQSFMSGRMTLKPGMNSTETGQFLQGEIARAGQNAIKNRRYMPV